jgi:superfamily II DNA or RNA helicase
MSFAFPFRRYQQLALEAFERAHAHGDRRIYLAMPPGSGKTVLGLEIARRVGRPTLVLSPTTAIQAQWLEEWGRFSPATVPASGEPDQSAGLTAVTYQALCVLDPGDGATPHERSRRRALIARGGDQDEVLALLHPNGRAIVDRMAAAGPITLVLDECHHLLRLWGHLLEAVIEQLGAATTTVVGLTATPPSDLGAREATLYRSLFGHGADFGVVTPAVVREGFLAPYQELALLVQPTPAERQYIDGQQARFEALVQDLQRHDFASRPFSAWFARRVLDPSSQDGAPVAWSVIERDEPDLAQAALRLQWSRGAQPPRGALYREQHRRAPEAADWIALLEGFVTDVLDASEDPLDAQARERIRLALPAVGYQLTRRGIRASASVTDRVLALSASKVDGVASILETELAVLRDSLRALVLCDFETAGRDVGARLRGVLDPGAGSAALLLRSLLGRTPARDLEPVLVTGRSVASSRATAQALVEFAAAALPDVPLVVGDDLPETASLDWDDPVVIRSDHPGWTSRGWVPLVTAFFEAGRTRCLVGTRALLGEGWDSHPVNVLIDCGTATTSVSVHQVRGRSLRLDPHVPRKVADNWDVVCVAPTHARGTADYERFVRKHRAYFALTRQGEIESGVSHVDPTLSPFGPPPADTFDALNGSMHARARERASVWQAWRIGEPYRDVPVPTVRVHLGRPMGVPERDVLRAAPPDRSPARIRGVSVATGVGASAAVVAGAAVALPLLGLAAAGVVVAGGVGWGLNAVRDGISRLEPSASLEDLARAVAEALGTTGIIAPDLGPDHVRVVPQPDGYYRAYLDGAATEDAERFATALDEVVSPLWDPRWIVPRRVAQPPGTILGTAGLLAGRSIAQTPPELVVHHGVPDALATRKDRVAAFQQAWRRWVSPGATCLPVSDPRAQAVLALHRGDDPFAVTTQMRTLWT